MKGQEGEVAVGQVGVSEAPAVFSYNYNLTQRAFLQFASRWVCSES